jgi:hypothetical protein
MPAWLDRTKGTIDLTSPSGLIFNAKWRNNNVAVSSKASVRSIPDLNGDVVQSQGTGSERHDLVVIFTGENNDLNARYFQKTLIAEQKNKWTIEHPVEGTLTVLWIGDSIRDVDPTSKGNVTTVSCQWIEALEDTRVESSAQLQDNVEIQARQANDKTAEQVTEVAIVDEPVEKQSFVSSIASVISSANSFLAIVENFQIIDPQILAIVDAIEVALAGEIIDTTALAGQVQQLIQKYSLGQSTANDGIVMFSEFIDNVLLNVPLQPNTQGKSQIAGTELSVSAAIIAACQVSLIGGFLSRGEVLTAIDGLNLILDNTRTALDEIQELYADNPIDTIYWSQSSGYADIQKIVSDAIRYLENSLLGLPSERTVILEKDTAPAQVTKDEYGTVTNDGESLDQLDFFFKTNPDIMGDLLYLLPASYGAKVYTG